MPTLHVRNVSESLYERLRKRARQRKRSLSAEVIILLDFALEESEDTQTPILEGIRRRRSFAPIATGAPSSTTLLREERER